MTDAHKTRRVLNSLCAIGVVPLQHELFPGIMDVNAARPSMDWQKSVQGSSKTPHRDARCDTFTHTYGHLF